MKLSPHQILSMLGLNVPEEGVEINPNDAFLYSETLNSLGATMDVSLIPEQDLKMIHVGLQGLAQTFSDDKINLSSTFDADKMRIFIASICSSSFSLNITNRGCHE